MPTPPPDAPGQFALADPDRVRGILGDSGWNDVVLDPVDVPCTLPASRLEDYALSMGPLGKLLPTVDDATGTFPTGRVFAPVARHASWLLSQLFTSSAPS